MQPGRSATHYAVFIPEKFQVRVYKTDTKQLVAIRTAGDWDTAETVVKPWGRPDILTVSEAVRNAGMNYDSKRGLERTRGIERRRKVRLD